MPTTLSEKATATVRGLLIGDWTPTNTAGYNPAMPGGADLLPLTFGNYTSSLSDPQISLAQPSGEDTMGSGAYTSFQGDGTGPNQDRVGDILCQCWAEQGTVYNDGLSAEDTVELLRKEVERIVHANADPSADTDWFSLSSSWEGRFPDPDDVADPMWQSQIVISYMWMKTPPKP